MSRAFAPDAPPRKASPGLTPEERAAMEKHLAEKGVTKVPSGASAFAVVAEPRTNSQRLDEMRAKSQRMAAHDRRMARLREAEAQARALEAAAHDRAPLPAPAASVAAPSPDPAVLRSRSPAGQPARAEAAVPARPRDPASPSSPDPAACRAGPAGQPAPAARRMPLAPAGAGDPVPGEDASGLARVAPVSLGSHRPAPLNAPPELAWLPIEALRIDHGYQRRPSERSLRRVRQIAAGWDWAQVKALNVARLGDGSYEVIDGQHTAIAAASHGGIGRLPCLIVSGRARASRAAAFVGINTSRTAITPVQRFLARLAAGHGAAVLVDRAAREAGARICGNTPNHGWRPGDTVAVVALQHLAKARGQAGVTRVLKICVAAGLAPIRAEHVAALRSLLWAPEYRGTPMPQDRLARLLREDWPGIDAEARAQRGRLTQPQAAAVAMFRRLA